MGWLTLIGIGEDGLEGLSPRARTALASAEHVFGGARHLDLVASAIVGTCHFWLSPISRSVEEIAGLAGQKVVVLASGDPFWFGIGATLARSLPADAFVVHPAPSAFSLAAARLGWALQEVETISAHGRPLALVRKHFQPGAKLLVLTADGMGPNALARLLVANGFEQSQMTVFEALGGPHERRTCAAAGDLAGPFADLNIVAVDIAAGADARVLPLSAGRSEALFEHDGQISKGWVRSLTLSGLAPRRGDMLWDIGAGSGSIAIEWMLTHPSLRAIAVEVHPDRAERLTRNAVALGVPGLEVVRGSAPQALTDLTAPDAIFVGGGGSDRRVMASAMSALRQGGRLVANAVTLEMEAVLLALRSEHGGELARFNVSQAAPIGSMTGWRPAMPLTQWRWVKP